MKMVKCLPEYEYFTVFLKNRNFISIRISKVTDYAALMCVFVCAYQTVYAQDRYAYFLLLYGIL